jgi:hypothetical protein
VRRRADESVAPTSRLGFPRLQRSMTDDISRILNAWEYEPGELRVRRIEAEDGRPLIQIRMDLGIMQLEWRGRPDGRRPHDEASLLDHYRQERDRHETPEPFLLSREDCWSLGQEAVQYYWRRISFFELKEYERAEEDAVHNLGILDLCGDHGEQEEDRALSDQYRVFVTAHRIQARALTHLEREEHSEALDVIRKGIVEVETILRDQGDPEAMEDCTELSFLRDWEREVEESVDLEAAVEDEEFELAASLRDKLKEMDGGPGQTGLR